MELLNQVREDGDNDRIIQRVNEDCDECKNDYTLLLTCERHFI